MEEIDKEEVVRMPTNAFLALVSDVLASEEISVDTLRFLKAEMERRGFNAPFSFLIKAGKEEEMKELEAADRKKQLAYFRRIATLKKYSLFAAKIAIAARKMKKFALKHGYVDLASFLPTNGDHLSPVILYGTLGIITYRNLLDIMVERGNVEEGKAYLIEGEGYTRVKRMRRDKLPSLREGERIVKEKRVSLVVPLIKSRIVAKALASAITAYAGFIAYREAEEALGDERVKRYNEIVVGLGYLPFANVERSLEEDRRLYGLLEKEGFIENGLLSPAIVRALAREKARISERMNELSLLMLAVPLAKHYFLKDEAERKLKPLYPSLQLKPTPAQLSLFNVVDKLVGFNLAKALEEKLRWEEYGESRKIAYATVALQSREAAKKFFGASDEEIDEALAYLEGIKRGRGKEFLDKLKGKR